jgi:hypothetical protein
MLRERRQPGYLDQHLRVLLHRRGDPICVETAADEKDYFSWFLIETYAFPEVLSEFRNALGFCLRHGARLARYSSCATQISYLHGHAARHAVRLLESSAGRDGEQQLALLASPAPCPACASLQASEERTLFFLEKFLSDSSGFDVYGKPGMLCFPLANGIARLLHENPQAHACHARSCSRICGETTRHCAFRGRRMRFAG